MLVVQQVNWNELGALAGIAGVLLVVFGVVGRWVKNMILAEIQRNQAGIDNMNQRITTPGDLPPIGPVMGEVLAWQKTHDVKENARFERIEDHLGMKTTPAKAPKKAVKKTAGGK